MRAGKCWCVARMVQRRCSARGAAVECKPAAGESAAQAGVVAGGVQRYPARVIYGVGSKAQECVAARRRGIAKKITVPARRSRCVRKVAKKTTVSVAGAVAARAAGSSINENQNEPGTYQTQQWRPNGRYGRWWQERNQV